MVLQGGTYYPSSGTYVSPSGAGMSIRPQDIPKGTQISLQQNPQLRNLPSNIRQIDVTLPDVPKQDIKTYDPRLGMYTSVSPTGQRGTISARSPTPDEQRRLDIAQERGSLKYIAGKTKEKISEKIEEKGKKEAEKLAKIGILGGAIVKEVEPYVKPAFEKTISILEPIGKGMKEGTKQTIKELQLMGDVSKELIKTSTPYVKQGSSFLFQELKKDYTKRLEKDIQKGKIVLGTGNIIFEKTSPYIAEKVKTKAQKEKEKLEKIGAVGGLVFSKVEPYVKPVTEKTFSLLEPIGKGMKEGTKQTIKELQLIGGAGVKTAGALGYKITPPTKDYLFTQVRERFEQKSILSPFIEVQQKSRFARKWQQPTYEVYGVTLPTPTGKGEVYSTYAGIKGLVSAGSSDIALKSGLGEFIAGVKKQSEARSIPRSSNFLMSELSFQERPPIVTPPTQEEIKAESEAFGGRVTGTLDFATYFTPIQPVKIGLGLGESAVGGFGYGAPTNPLQFAQRETGDVVFLGTLGLLKGGGKVLEKARKPVISIRELQPEKPILEPLFKVSRPTRRTISGNVLEDIYKVQGVASDVKAGSQTSITTPLRQRFGLKPVYEGLPTDTKGYQKALKILKKGGYTERQAKEIIRLRRPVIEQDVLTGEAKIVYSDEGTNLFFKGERRLTKAVKDVQGVKSRGGEGKIFYIKSSGVPVKAEGEIDLFRFVQQDTQAYLKGKTPFSKLRQAGKTTTISEVTSGSKELAEQELFKLYQGADISKQTIPTQRRLKIGRAKVITEKGEPLITITREETSPVTSFQGGGKKSSPEFLQQMFSGEKPLTALSESLVREQKPVKTITSQVIKEIKPTTQAPVTQPSLYAGTGLYERTEEFGGVSPTIQTRQDNILRTGLTTNTQPQVTFQDLGLRTDLGIKTDLQTRTDIKTDLMTGVRTDLGIKTFTDTKIRSDVKSQTKTAPKTLMEMLPIQQKGFKTTTKPKPQIKPPTPKTPLIPIPTTFGKTTKKKKKKKKILDEDFEVYVRKGGKDISIGEAETLGEARQKLKTRLLETARASGFIKKGKEKLKFEEVGSLGMEFRKSKVSPFRVVQRKTQRIKRAGEIGEIISARGKRKSGGFF